MSTKTVQTLLAEGSLDEAGVKLLYTVVRSTARRHRYPPPEGEQSWTPDAVHTVAHDFLTGRRSAERLIQLAAQATTDQQFAALLRTAVLNYFRDTARTTVVGKQVRRLKDVAAVDARFVVRGNMVALAQTPEDAAPFAGDEARLVQSIASFKPLIRRWRPDTHREGPLADREETSALIQTILSAAGGACSFATLARTLALRFELTEMPAAVPVDVLDSTPASPFAPAEVADQVDHILAQLTEREKLLLPLMDGSSRDIAMTIGLGRTTVAKTQVRLRSLLRELIPTADADDIARELLVRLQRSDEGPDT